MASGQREHPVSEVMETIHHEGRQFSVREVVRFKQWLCRVLAADDGTTFLEYLVSVGPYKIDIAVVHALSVEELTAYKAGTLHVGELARSLAERDMASGKHEQKKP